MSVCNTSHVGGVTVLAKVPRLSRHQKEILRAYILKQRKEKAEEEFDGGIRVRSVSSSEDGITTSPSYDDEVKSRADRAREQGQQLQDIKTQISNLQSKLVSLKEEKHRLFRQLKTVLNEEDEKNRVKDEEQKHSESNLHLPVSGDHKVSGVKRPLQSPGLGLPYTKQQQLRGPLLPTPEPNQFSRQNPYFWPGSGSDQTSSSGSGTRHTLNSPQPHHFTASRPGPNEPRFGVMPAVPAAAHTGSEGHVSGHSIPYSHPMLQDASVQPTPSSGVSYQYNLTPPYGSVSSPTCSSSQTRAGPGTPFNQMGQVFQLPLQHHSHNYKPLGEAAQIPVPQDLPTVYPPQDVTYIAQGGLLTPGQGMAHTYQMHDPRQHRLMAENHVTSTTPIHPQPSREVRLKK